MNLTFETHLEVVRRALVEVVLPALDGAPGHVIEQLHLSLAATGFMQQRLPYARRYYRTSLATWCDMAEAVVALVPTADPLATDAAKARSLLESPIAEDIDYQRAAADLRNGIAALVEASPGASYEAALDALVLERSEAILLQDRVWCLPLGFELRPEGLPAPAWAD